MVPDQTKTSLGLEYFCNEGDELWNAADSDLVEQGKKEIQMIGLANYNDVLEGCVFRVEKAYPVYDLTYSRQLLIIRNFVDSLENFQSIGRNGLHRYNNQDHAILTGKLAARNAIFDESNDIWNVNAEQEYLEVLSSTKVPSQDTQKVVESVLTQVFHKLDPKSLGLSLGIILGLILFSVTVIVYNNNMNMVEDKLWLLVQYFPGYQVNFTGGLLGLLYGFILGFIIGWAGGVIRNTATLLSMIVIRRQAQNQLLRKILDL